MKANMMLLKNLLFQTFAPIFGKGQKKVWWSMEKRERKGNDLRDSYLKKSGQICLHNGNRLLTTREKRRKQKEWLRIVLVQIWSLFSKINWYFMFLLCIAYLCLYHVLSWLKILFEKCSNINYLHSWFLSISRFGSCATF